MTAAIRRQDGMGPALLAALALHLGLLAALIWLHPSTPLPIGTSVPINIVASGPTTDSRPAVQAPIAQDAQTPAPVREARPPEPAPAPPTPRMAAPKPTPPVPRPAPAPPPTPARPTPSRFDLAQIQADVAGRKSFSLSALAADVSREARSHPSRPAFAQRGPSRAETALETRVDAGTGVSQSDIAGLSQLLERLWNPDCSVETRVVIPVKFTVGFDGRLQGKVDSGGREASPSPVISVAARRAIDAVHEAAPYAQTYRGLTITVRFDAAKACAMR